MSFCFYKDKISCTTLPYSIDSADRSPLNASLGYLYFFGFKTSATTRIAFEVSTCFALFDNFVALPNSYCSLFSSKLLYSSNNWLKVHILFCTSPFLTNSYLKWHTLFSAELVKATYNTLTLSNNSSCFFGHKLILLQHKSLLQHYCLLVLWQTKIHFFSIKP
jgi:hypothetical protein